MAERLREIQLPKTRKRYGLLLPRTPKSIKLVRKQLFILCCITASLFLFESCKNINSNILFRIPKKSDFKYDSIPLIPQEDFRLAPGDRFNFVFGTNNGENIVLNLSGVNNQITGTNQQQQQQQQQMLRNNGQNQMNYLVRQDGKSNLPLLGVVEVAGKTIVQLEEEIKSQLSDNYVNPFVQIRVTNQRVIIFPGKGDAEVVQIQNANTSLLEAIALAGGIRDEGRANSIKLMRKTRNGREIYKIDLSTIKGLRNAQMIVQSNDYIYVDFKPRWATSFLVEITPWLSVMTTALLTWSIIRPN
jgi:polysaccharide export outer membrane protein